MIQIHKCSGIANDLNYQTVGGFNEISGIVFQAKAYCSKVDLDLSTCKQNSSQIDVVMVWSRFLDSGIYCQGQQDTILSQVSQNQRYNPEGICHSRGCAGSTDNWTVCVGLSN